jgi:hypothetical protein
MTALMPCRCRYRDALSLQVPGCPVAAGTGAPCRCCRPCPRPPTPGAAADGTTASRPLDCSLLQEWLNRALLLALARRQPDGDRLASPFGAQGELGGEAALAAPERLLLLPPFTRRAPAACWCAPTTVASTSCCDQSSLPTAAPCGGCSGAKLRSPTPRRGPSGRSGWPPSATGRTRWADPARERRCDGSRGCRSGCAGDPPQAARCAVSAAARGAAAAPTARRSGRLCSYPQSIRRQFRFANTP